MAGKVKYVRITMTDSYVKSLILAVKATKHRAHPLEVHRRYDDILAILEEARKYPDRILGEEQGQ